MNVILFAVLTAILSAAALDKNLAVVPGSEIAGRLLELDGPGYHEPDISTCVNLETGERGSDMPPVLGTVDIGPARTMAVARNSF